MEPFASPLPAASSRRGTQKRRRTGGAEFFGKIWRILKSFCLRPTCCKQQDRHAKRKGEPGELNFLKKFDVFWKVFASHLPAASSKARGSAKAGKWGRVYFFEKFRRILAIFCLLLTCCKQQKRAHSPEVRPCCVLWVGSPYTGSLKPQKSLRVWEVLKTLRVSGWGLAGCENRKP